MHSHIICRFGEIGLKGKNRVFFERKLVNNIAACLRAEKILFGKVSRPWGRIVVECMECVPALRRVFGLVSFSYATKVALDMEDICKEALRQASSFRGSFRVHTQRMNKQFPVKSPEINVQLGKEIMDTFRLECRLKGAEHTLFVEVVDDGAFVFSEKVACCGGLPVGVEGKAAVFINQEEDVLAALFALKRGCRIIVYAHEGVDVSVVEKFSYGAKVVVRKLTDAVTENVVFVGDSVEKVLKYEGLSCVLRPLVGVKNSKEKLHEFECFV